MDIIKALEIYNKTVEGTWAVNEDYTSLQWFGAEEDKPSEDVLQQCWEQYVIERERNQYKVLRKAEYPSLENQLDMIYHNGVEAWKLEIKKIKDKYPKPE